MFNIVHLVGTVNWIQWFQNTRNEQP